MRYLYKTLLILVIVGCSRQIEIYKSKIINYKWTPISIEGNKSVPRNAYIVLKESSFSGFGGCNDFNGTITLTKDFIIFKFKDIDTKVCEDIYLESKFIKAVSKTTNLVVKGKSLYFKNEDDNTLITLTR